MRRRRRRAPARPARPAPNSTSVPGSGTGKTGSERIYDGYPDVGLEMTASRTFDGRIQLLEYVPRVLDGPPGA